FLLTEFQAKEALPAIVDAVSLPDDLTEALFGDVVTEVLARMLACLAADETDVLDGLISNRQVNEYVRWAAADAVVLLVRDGRLTREDAVARLRRHLRNSLDTDDRPVVGPLVITLENLGAKEAYAEIVEAFDRVMIDKRLIDLKCVDDAFVD